MSKSLKILNLICCTLLFILFTKCSIKKSDNLIVNEPIPCKYKIEAFDSPERQKEINSLKENIESNEMNPNLKETVSEFAIDTFKIGFFQRKFPVTKVDTGTSLDVQKSVCVMNDSLIDKYFNKLKKILKNKDYDDLIISQTEWEKYRNKELSIFQRLTKEEIDFEFNFYVEYNQILKLRLNTLFFYYYTFKD